MTTMAYGALAILVGIFMGYKFSGGFLLLITIIIVVINAISIMKSQEIAVMIAMAYALFSFVFLVAVWITYYISTDGTVLHDLGRGISNIIFR